MDWILIILFITLGFIALILEILVIPGFGVVGVLGFGGIAFGIYEAYSSHGIMAGNITLLATIIVSIFLAIMIMRSKTWKKMMLNDNISSRVNEIPEEKVKVGMEGVTVSRLAPSGKARIGDDIYEVDTYGLFVNQNETIEVLKIEGNKIIVKTKN